MRPHVTPLSEPAIQTVADCRSCWASESMAPATTAWPAAATAMPATTNRSPPTERAVANTAATATRPPISAVAARIRSDPPPVCPAVASIPSTTAAAAPWVTPRMSGEARGLRSVRR